MQTKSNLYIFNKTYINKIDYIKYIMEMQATMESPSAVEQHPLHDKWVLWAHLPHDTDWTLTSYIKIMELNYGPYTLEPLLLAYPVYARTAGVMLCTRGRAAD